MKRSMAVLLALVLAGGCTSAAPLGSIAPGSTAPAGTPGTPAQPTTGSADLAIAKVPHLPTSTPDATRAAGAVNAFAAALYARLAAADANDNLVVSPTSIALALAMARAGARGATATEMDAVLHELGTDAHAAWLGALDAALSARTGSFPDAEGKPRDVTLRIANAPFAQRGLALEPAYLDALASRFGAGLRLVDYRAEPEAARGAINGWVAGATEQRIKELLASGTVDTDTRLVLVNAIYLKAAWESAFEEAATQPGAFTRGDGSKLDVPMMHASLPLPYAAGDGWRAVQLPYVGGKLGLLVVVPDDRVAFEKGFDEAPLGSISAALASREVVLGMPRFGAESKLELKPILAALGMPTAFTDHADFSGITKDVALEIAKVVHQANIDVDEKGTEAAAATAVVMRETAMPADPPVTLTVDRPFLFALRDLETGAVLFLGRINDPAAKAKE